MKAIFNLSTFILAAVLASVFAAGCQTATESRNSSANASATNTTTQPAANSNQPAAPAKTEESAAASSGSQATPTDAYKTGYAARKNKDIAALKRVLSKEALDFLTEMGKEEKKTLDDQLRELAERPQAATAETRNEKIDGDDATLEYLNDKGGWSTMHLVKEGGDWKIGLPKAQK